MGIFEMLLEIDNSLVEWLIHASPRSAEESRSMIEVLALREDLSGALNRLVSVRLKLSVARLSQDAARLAAVSAEMKKVVRTIDSVEQVISIAGTVVEIATKVVTTVLG